MSQKFSAFCLCSLSAAIISSIANTAVAQEQVEKVYVSATRSETVQLPVASQIIVIDQEQIRLSGAKLLSEVLRTQAGVQLTDSDGSGARNVTVSLRGLAGANNVLVLVDGRKLNNPSLAAPALNTVALKDVERIEILQGSAGVLYGDQAVGGVINIITRHANAGEMSGNVTAMRGSSDLEDYTASLSQGFENGVSYRLSAQKRTTDNYRDNNNANYQNLLANLRYQFAQGFVFVEGQHINDQLRLPGSLSDDDASDDRRQTFTPNDFSNQITDTWRLGGGYEFNDQWKLLSEYSDRNEEGEYENYGLTQYSVRVKSLTPRLVGTLASGHGNALVTVGVDAVRSDYESNNYYSPVNSEQDQQSIYAQLIYPVLEQLTATAGVRRAQVKDQNYQASLKQKDSLTASEFGLNYDFGNQWSLFGRYAESFRFGNPDENNLVASTVVFLEPQSGKSWEVGSEWSDEKSHVSYSLYQMKINDEIVYDSFTPNNQGYNGANINLPNSERKGLLLSADTQLSQEISLRLNYSYTDAQVVDGEYKGKAVPFVAKNAGSASLVLTPVVNLSFTLEANYTGARYRSNDDANSAAQLPELVVFNLGGLYSYRHLDVSLRINNITNELYAGYHSLWGQYPQPERNYQLGLAYSFY